MATLGTNRKITIGRDAAAPPDPPDPGVGLGSVALGTAPLGS